MAIILLWFISVLWLAKVEPSGNGFRKVGIADIKNTTGIVYHIKEPPSCFFTSKVGAYSFTLPSFPTTIRR